MLLFLGFSINMVKRKNKKQNIKKQTISNLILPEYWIQWPRDHWDETLKRFRGRYFKQLGHQLTTEDLTEENSKKLAFLCINPNGEHLLRFRGGYWMDIGTTTIYEERYHAYKDQNGHWIVVLVLCGKPKLLCQTLHYQPWLDYMQLPPVAIQDSDILHKPNGKRFKISCEPDQLVVTNIVPSKENVPIILLPEQNVVDTTEYPFLVNKIITHVSGKYFKLLDRPVTKEDFEQNNANKLICLNVSGDIEQLRYFAQKEFDMETSVFDDTSKAYTSTIFPDWYLAVLVECTKTEASTVTDHPYASWREFMQRRADLIGTKQAYFLFMEKKEEQNTDTLHNDHKCQQASDSEFWIFGDDSTILRNLKNTDKVRGKYFKILGRPLDQEDLIPSNADRFAVLYVGEDGTSLVNFCEKDWMYSELVYQVVDSEPFKFCNNPGDGFYDKDYQAYKDGYSWSVILVEYLPPKIYPDCTCCKLTDYIPWQEFMERKKIITQRPWPRPKDMFTLKTPRGDIEKETVCVVKKSTNKKQEHSEDKKLDVVIERKILPTILVTQIMHAYDVVRCTRQNIWLLKNPENPQCIYDELTEKQNKKVEKMFNQIMKTPLYHVVMIKDNDDETDIAYFTVDDKDSTTELDFIMETIAYRLNPDDANMEQPQKFTKCNLQNLTQQSLLDGTVTFLQFVDFL
jgi:hypothetical protein